MDNVHETLYISPKGSSYKIADQARMLFLDCVSMDIVLS
jgi:hypothetical protein